MNPVKSKINWTALLLLGLGIITDPNVLGLLPTEWASKILMVSGPVLFILRQFFTKPADPAINPPNIP